VALGAEISLARSPPPCVNEDNHAPKCIQPDGHPALLPIGGRNRVSLTLARLQGPVRCRQNALSASEHFSFGFRGSQSTGKYVQLYSRKSSADAVMVHGKVYRVALMASCFDISQKLIHFTSGESPDIPKSHGSMIAVTDPLSINLKAISTSCQMSCDGVMCVSSWLATPSSISHGSANGEYAAMSCRFQRPRQFLSYQIISGLMLCETIMMLHRT
jgi:hypothetical protein